MRLGLIQTMECAWMSMHNQHNHHVRTSTEHKGDWAIEAVELLISECGNLNLVGQSLQRYRLCLVKLRFCLSLFSSIPLSL